MNGILSTGPRKAFIMVGINDFNANRRVEDVVADYRRIVQALKDNAIEVFIQSTLDCSRTGCPREQVKELNVILEALAEAQGVGWLDLNKVLSTKEHGLRSEYTFDGVHLNGDGYAAWRTIIADAVLP